MANGWRATQSWNPVSRYQHRILVLAAAFWFGLLAAATERCPAQEHDETPVQLSGLSVSQAFEIEDDQQLDRNSPLIRQLLYRIKKTSPKSRSEFSQYSRQLTWEDIEQRTEDYRLWVFDRPARLKYLEKHRFKDLLPDAEIKGMYIGRCVNANGQPFVIIARSMPRAIETDTRIDAPVRMTGFLYARARVDGSPSDAASIDDEVASVPVFICDRLAWFPDRTVEGKASPSHVQLAQQGVDIGLLDTVRESNTRSLGTRDSEALFQMLAGVKKFNAPFAGPRINFTDLQKNSTNQVGNAIRIRGLVRSCNRIAVTDQDIQQRVGLTHYYQLIVFPDLQGGKIVLEDNTGESQEFKRYPITVCCPDLPDGLQAADLERRPLVVDGFFFRFWKFQSETTDLAGKSGLASPLIIAKFLTPVKSQADRLNLVLLIFTIAVITGIAALLWVYRRSDRKREIEGNSLLESLPEKIDLEGIGE